LFAEVKTRRQGYMPIGARALAVNSEQYLKMDPAKIPVDERFFYE
jgi:hypothetical protein